MQANQSERLSEKLLHHWQFIFNVVFGLYVLVPFLAPVFMHLGLTGAGKVIYLFYSFLCHQLPQRSYFLFGPKISYSVAEILSADLRLTPTFLSLRAFNGTPEMGWKVAWSDRMISMYGSVWVLGLIWGRIGQKARRLPWWGFLLFILPMAVDGISHLISEITNTGFRASNPWLVHLTSGLFPAAFYAGDAWGSFNSLMRLLTGILFGIGTVWFGYPYLDNSMAPFRPDETHYRAPSDFNHQPDTNQSDVGCD